MGERWIRLDGWNADAAAAKRNADFVRQRSMVGWWRSIFELSLRRRRRCLAVVLIYVDGEWQLLAF